MQRGFLKTFGLKKPPRVGEEMAASLQLNPVTEYTSPREFRKIGEHREHTHRWFDHWFYAPIHTIRDNATRAMQTGGQVYGCVAI